jgi:hypothetical protein
MKWDKRKMKRLELEGKVKVVCIILFILFYVAFSCSQVYAQPLPPSEHILFYEEFVSSNAYAGEFVSVNAKIGKIERSKDLDWYRIGLLSLEGKEFSNKGWVLVNHSCGIEIVEGEILTRDKDIGIVIGEGDIIVVVGKAGKIVGMNREMVVGADGEGTVILLLSEEAYEKEKSIRGGKTIRDFSFNFDVVGSYGIVGGELKMNRRVETKKFFALGNYELSRLGGNYELLDGDGDRLMSPFDPFPDTKDRDGDGLDDKEEMEFRTRTRMRDTDGDDLSDYEEVKGTTGYITNPINADTDGDRLTDYEEVFGFEVGGITYKCTNPCNPDTDGDGKIDSVDDVPCERDTDGDGLSDTEEEKIGTKINDKDTDDDGLTDYEEVRGTRGYKTDPLKKDTDGDGLSDLEEIEGMEILSKGEYIEHGRWYENLTSYGVEKLPCGEDGMPMVHPFDNIYISDPTKQGTKGVGRSDKEELEMQRQDKKAETKDAEEIIGDIDRKEKIYQLIGISSTIVFLIALIIVLMRWRNIAPVNVDVRVEKKLFRRK